MTNPKYTLRSWLFASVVTVCCGACDSDVAPSAETFLTVEEVGESTPGNIAFTVDQIEYEFEYLPAGANFYYPFVSAVSAKPAYDAEEELTLNFPSMDLKALEYPVLLRKKVGIIYVNSEGTEWAGPAPVTLESFDANGTLTGRFSDVSLPHTEKVLPNVVLGNGRIEVELGRP